MGIALLRVPGKVFCKVIQKRVAETAEEMLMENQCSFRSGRGCMDQIFTLRVVAEKAREFNTSFNLAFIYMRKSNDSLNWRALWEVLDKKYLLPSKLVCILRALHKRHQGSDKTVWQSVRRVRRHHWNDARGCVSMSLLRSLGWCVFAATMSTFPSADVRMLYSLDRPPVQHVGSRMKMRDNVIVSDLEYADDMVLVSDSMDVLKEALRVLKTFGVGMDQCKKDKGLGSLSYLHTQCTS